MFGIREKYRKSRRKIKKCIIAILKCKEKYIEVSSYEDNAIVLWGIPEYGNLGDQAITYAENEFICKCCPERKIYMISEAECLDYVIPMKLLTIKKNLLFISPGGGNMGTMYIYQEKCRQLLIGNMKRSRIIVFPQSVDYVVGTSAHKKAKRMYENCANLTLFARDKYNYIKMQKLFPNTKVCLSPDIVSSIKVNAEGNNNRSRVLCCLRLDKEQNKKLKEKIDLVLDYVGRDNCDFEDTYGEKYVNKYELQKEQIEAFWMNLRQHKLVITDRLHGMIFAMINNIPCVVFDNTTGKVNSFYSSWLKDSNGIKFFNGQINEVYEFIDKCDVQEKIKVFVDLNSEFEQLRNEILS